MIGPAKLIISYGAWPSTASTVLGQESVIQKYLKASAVPLHFVKRRHDSLGNTPWVTYALTDSAPYRSKATASLPEVSIR